MIVDKNVPIPDTYTKKGGPYKLRSMNVGDSMFAPGGYGLMLRGAAKVFAHRNAEYKFTCRKVVENGIEGHRIWRVDA